MKLISQIKKDLEFNRNLSVLVNVLKEIAISQYHILEKKIKTYDRFFLILESLLDIIPQTNIQHPLLNWTRRRPGVIAITSDTGLLGALNMEVMSLALHEAEKSQAKLIIVGQKGRIYAQECGISFVAFDGIKDAVRFAQALQLRDYIVNEVLNQRLGALKVIYPYATSIVAQHIQSLQLLPFSKPEKTKKSISFSEIIIESHLSDTAGYLVYLFLGQKFFEIFGLSRLAEMAARFVHLEESGHKLEDIEKQLRLQYFRLRHELIDRNMREIYSARLAFG
jgi:ATP synthase F1 gamma subunit